MSVFFNKKSVFYLIHKYLKLWEILSVKRKRQIIFVLFFSLISGFSEFISVGTLIPFISILIDPSQPIKNQFLKSIFDIKIFDGQDQFYIFICILFIVITIISSLVRIFNLYINTKIIALVGNDIGRNMYFKLLNQNYYQYKEGDTNNFISTATTQLNQVVTSLTLLMNTFTNFTILFFMIFSLIISSYLSPLIILLSIFLIYLCMSNFVRNRIHINSLIISENSISQVAFIKEGMGLHKQITLNKSQNFFTSRFNSIDKSLRLAFGNNRFISLFPRYVIEAIIIIFIASILILNLLNDVDSKYLLNYVGNISVISIKVIPLITFIFGTVTSLRGNFRCLENINSVLSLKINKFIPHNEDETTTQKYYFKESLKVRNLSFRYKGNKNNLINNISFEIKKGQRVGIKGESGKGKSTLTDIIMGLLSPTKGTVHVDGKNINLISQRNYLKAWQKSISYLSQDIFLINSSIAENIAFGVEPSLIDHDRLKKVAKNAEIYDYINSLENGFDTLILENGSKLSGGQRQRIAIARALYKDCQVLVLDEFTSALDLKTEEKLISKLEKDFADITIIICSHRDKPLSICDFIIDFD